MDSLDDWVVDMVEASCPQPTQFTAVSLYQPRSAFSNLDDYARYVKQNVKVS